MRAGKFEYYQSPKNNRWYWRYRSVNGLTTAISAGGKAGGYGSKDGVKRAISKFISDVCTDQQQAIRVVEVTVSSPR